MVFFRGKERDLQKFLKRERKAEEKKRREEGLEEPDMTPVATMPAEEKKKSFRFRVSPETRERVSREFGQVKKGLQSADRGAQRVAKAFDDVSDRTANLGGLDFGVSGGMEPERPRRRSNPGVDMLTGGFGYDDLFAGPSPVRTPERSKKSMRRGSEPDFSVKWF